MRIEAASVTIVKVIEAVIGLTIGAGVEVMSRAACVTG